MWSRHAAGRFGQPALERLFGTALDHVEQPGRAGVVADRGQVDDHGDVLVAAAGVPPDVLVDADDSDAVEAVRVVDQHPLPFGEDGVVGGVPRHPEPVGDPGDGEVLHHQALQCPPQPAAGQLRPRLRGPAGVLAPHMPALAAAVAADGDVQAGGSPPERLVRQPADHGAARDSLAAAAVAPVVGVDDPARQHGRSGSSRCPVTTRPSSSRRQNTVRSGQPKTASGVASVTVEVFHDGECENFHLRETSTPTQPATRRPLHPHLRRATSPPGSMVARGEGRTSAPPRSPNLSGLPSAGLKGAVPPASSEHHVVPVR